MKIALPTPLIFIFLILMSFNSCKKYSEDDGTSFKTAKNRLTGEWVITSVLIGESEVIRMSPYTEEMNFSKNGDYIQVTNTGEQEFGTWEFIEKKEKIRLTLTGAFTATTDLSIIKLTDSEMILEQTYTSPFLETWRYILEKN